MDVTKTNFLSILAKFEEFLEKSEFVAIDEEMSGMSLKDISESCFDSVEESYEKKRMIASSYLLVQVGICLFERTASGKYLIRPFNFFSFPSSDPSFKKLVRPVTLEAEAVAFHRRNNMDFQRWIYEGVGYCTEKEEELYREHLEGHYAPMKQNIVLGDNDYEAAQKIVQYIKNWTNMENHTKDLALPQTDSRLVRKYVESHLSDIAPGYECSFRGKLWFLVPKKDEVHIDKIKEERVINFCGIREIFKLLVKHRKPIVGHNMLMDLFFLIAGVDRPIPSSIGDFQCYMNSNFPSVWDTKVLASADPSLESKLRYTSLQYLFEYYLDCPVIVDKEKKEASSPGFRDLVLNETALEGMEFPLGFERYSVVLKKRRLSGSTKHTLAHEAAFDSLCTGFIFLQLRASLSDDIFRSCHNHVAIFKNYAALSTSTSGPVSKKICRGPVLRLSYSTSHEVEVEASLAPLKGRVEWRENGMAAAVLNSVHTIDEGLQHYTLRNDDIKAENFL